MPYAATAHLGQPITGVSLILILRAFTSGSASLTGVEAISNAVPFFKKPKAKNAASTLFIMSSILGLCLRESPSSTGGQVLHLMQE